MKIKWITPAVLAALFLPSGQAANKIAGTDQARETLKEVRESAVKAANDIDPLQQMSNGLSADSHYDHLMALRDDVNRMGRAIASLEAEADSLAPWERQAVEKVEPMLKQTATDTQQAIDYFNTNRAGLWTPGYRAMTAGAYEGSEDIARTLQKYLKFSKANDRAEHLREDLDVTGE